VPSGEGLYRFTGVAGVEDLARATPSAFYTTADGLAGGDIWRIYEDARGDLWLATRVPGREALTRWDRRRGVFERFGVDQGLPEYSAIASIAEDAAGQLWVGFWDGGAARRRQGRFERVPGLTEPVVAWHSSPSGTLWAASLGRGLLRFDRPTADAIAFTAIGTAAGLPSLRILGLADDDHGRLYLTTPAGVTRFDPTDGTTRTYTIEDGLARSEARLAYRDRTGAMWFGTDAGVSRLLPETVDADAPPRLLIGGARVNGTPLSIPDLGTPEAGPFELGVDQRYVEVDYIALGSGRSSDLQYRLEGAEEEWTSAGGRRTVHYARLASGTYRFVVRAPGPKGATEASLAFTIPPPLYRRWWFVATLCGIAAAAIVVAHRARVARLLAVERVRTRIAGDLHDDIGTNLSQIAILGELLKRPQSAGSVERSIARIADLSRESVDSLSDIVWSIDPEKDRLGNLVTRMRRLTGDLLPSRAIEWEFAAAGDADLAIGAEVRRDVFLSFKEALNNVVRHAGCRRVAIDVRLEDGRIRVTVSDDGVGFDTSRPAGHGLSSLRRRAARLGGTVSIRSAPGAGTTIELDVPASSRPS
jgi:signal transduction histidine kinase